MTGSARLAVWTGEQVDVLVIRWEKGHDVDARTRVPKRLAASWRSALKSLRSDDVEEVAPFTNLPVSVSLARLTTTATGIYAVAKEAWGGVGWQDPPPYEIADPREDPGRKVVM